MCVCVFQYSLTGRTVPVPVSVPVQSFFSLVFWISLVNLKRGISLVILVLSLSFPRILWVRQGQKILGNFEVFLDKNQKTKEKKDRVENGSGGSGSAFGSCENGSDGSGFRFRFGSWATLKSPGALPEQLPHGWECSRCGKHVQRRQSLVQTWCSWPAPCPSFPCFFGIPCFFPLRGIPCFFERFPFFSRDFGGSVGIKKPCFFGGFPCLFPKNQGKEGQGLVNLLYVCLMADF